VLSRSEIVDLFLHGALREPRGDAAC
jgi:hypothetical protein